MRLQQQQQAIQRWRRINGETKAKRRTSKRRTSKRRRSKSAR